MFLTRSVLVSALVASSTVAHPHLTPRGATTLQADPAPQPGAVGLSHGVHVVLDTNVAGTKDHTILNPSGGVAAPATAHYLNFYSIAPGIAQDVDYCKYRLTTSVADQTQYVHQAGPGGSELLHDWHITSFNGYTIGKNVVFNGDVGEAGAISADGSMTSHPHGIHCRLPPANLVKDKTCTDSDGGTNTLRLAAICQW